MQISVICSPADLLCYADRWNSILQENGNTNPYITPDWIMGWWQFFGRGREMYILALEDGGDCIGFFPLMRSQKKLHTEMRLIGSPQAGRMNLVVRGGYEEIFVRHVIDHLGSMKGTVVFILHGLEAEDACSGSIREALGRRPYSIRTMESRVIDLTSNSREDFFESRQRHNRIKKTFSRERALAKLCNLQFQEAMPEELDNIFQLHEKRWSKKIDGNGFARGVSKDFFTWIASGSRSPYWNIHVYLLKAGKRPIGFTYGIECNGRFTFYRLAHDDDFAYFVPGMIITKRLIEECYQKKYDKFDFSTGDEQYKKHWTDEVEWIEKILFGTNTALAAFLVWMDRFRYAVKTFLKKSPVLVHFKRVTAGRLRYYLSGTPELAFFKKAGETIRQRGWGGLLRPLQNAFAGKNLFYSVPDAFSAPESAVGMRSAAIDETHLVASLTHMYPDKIIKRYAQGSWCQILLQGGKPIGYAWISSREIRNNQKLLWKPQNYWEYCCYDVCIDKSFKAFLHDALCTLAAQSLPKGRHALFFMVPSQDRSLIRAADKLFGKKDHTEQPLRYAAKGGAG